MILTGWASTDDGWPNLVLRPLLVP
jgi:hypothetical protein